MTDPYTHKQSLAGLYLALASSLFAVQGSAQVPEHSQGPQVLEIRKIAEPSDGGKGATFDLAKEKQRLVAWLDKENHRRLIADQPLSIAKFNSTPEAEGGPSTKRIRWVAGVITQSTKSPKRWDPRAGILEGSQAVEVFSEEEWQKGPSSDRRFLVELFPLLNDAPWFGASDLDAEQTRVAVDDDTRMPKLIYALKKDRQAAFKEWTSQQVGRQIAYVLNGRVRMRPVLRAPIDGQGVIVGGFTIGEAEELLRVLRMGAAETSVSATQGGNMLPASADPADLRAMQSSDAMLEAERKLRELIKQGKLEGIDRIVTFEEISSWPYEDGLKGMPRQLETMNGRHVMMTGFMLPIDEVENIREFLLVQSLWSCCYGQPPDINGIVRVVMKGTKRIDYQFDPIKVVGTFKVVAAYEDGYCVDIFQLHADSVEVIK